MSSDDTPKKPSPRERRRLAARKKPVTKKAPSSDKKPSAAQKSTAGKPKRGANRPSRNRKQSRPSSASVSPAVVPQPRPEPLRFVCTGAECTGKTTLAAALAEHFGTTWVPEFYREFTEKKGVVPVPADMEFIAREYMRRERKAAAQANGLLFLDTDLVTVCVYADHYYEACPFWVDRAARQREYAMHFLCEDDIPWEADGIQRDGEDLRSDMQVRFRRELRHRELNHVALTGTAEERLARAIEIVEAIRGKQREDGGGLSPNDPGDDGNQPSANGVEGVAG